MLAAACALGASIAWGLADFLGGLKSRTVPLLVVLLLAQVSGIAGIGLVVAIAEDSPPGSSVLWAVLAALFGCVGLASFYRGMAVGSISVVAPIVAVAAVVPVTFGIATGDDVSRTHLAGFGLALAGVALASFERGGGRAARVAAGVPWAIAAVIGFGGYYVPMHEASEQHFLWAFVFRVSFGVIALMLWLAFRPPLTAARGSLWTIALIGVADTLGNVLFAAASSQGDVSIVSVLATLYPVMTVGLAAIVLSERVDRLQQLGVVAALAGVVLISAG
ncbi:MAG: DMT family transporter [Actinobacteria bacterium]|nr:DMT family transporter [Actinomycetota bacterium]